ncbi:MAG TPA: 1,4-dihydroxy-6-naphthoate synthase [Candidatus Tumulicola sp.]
MPPLTLAYSPCPNDTYVFAALTNGLLSNAPEVRAELLDIDELNAGAARNAYDLVKVSYGAVPYLIDRYKLLRSGGALGRGCGPLVVAKPGGVPELFAGLADRTLAIPGERTTAFLLLQLALGRRPKTNIMRFDRIVDAVANGDVDAGLIIHESRFTYREANLIQVADLGEWWEDTTALPIPLGAIAVRDDVADPAMLSAAVRDSLRYAREHEDEIMPYVREHAFEMDDAVMRAHIDLYVNELTDDVGDLGIEAARVLFERGREARILSGSAEPQFV